MSDFFVLFVFLLFIYYGFKNPAVSFCGYVWVDTVVPQKVVFGFMAGKPISMVMALVCIFSLCLGFKKTRFPESKLYLFLIMFFLIWITISTSFAVYPDLAWIKWDTSFKTIFMSLLMVFAITKRSELELVVIIFVSSIMFFMISGGLKTITGGGGYGVSLIVGSDNSGMSESSTLAGFAVIVIPFILFLKNNTFIFPMLKEKNWFWYGTILLPLATVVGTTARTGLVSLGAYIAKNMLSWRNFIKVIFASILCVLIILFFAPDEWLERMNTLKNVENEGSAMGRVAVWKWTLDFVAERPFLGGGFQSYLANAGLLGDYVEGFDFKAKAFHSIYFEVLGENGYVGLVVYLSIIFLAFKMNRNISKKNTDNWSIDFAKCLNSAIFIYCIAGAFIGIAYRPVLFQLVAFSVINYSIVIRELGKRDNLQERNL